MADAAGKLTIWSSCQSVFRVQATVAEVLGLPMSRIRAIATRVGGAFGGKSDVTVQPLAALLALRTRRPVKLVLSRDDDFMMMRTRHPVMIWMKTGAMADGRLVARAARVTLDGGAYAEDSSAVLGFALLIARGPYRIDHIRMEGLVAYTNRLRAAGFRGYGNPQVTFAGECQIDEIAARLGRDPIDLRLQNACAPEIAESARRSRPAASPSASRSCATCCRRACPVAASAWPASPISRASSRPAPSCACWKMAR